jgi:hypothetical protein
VALMVRPLDIVNAGFNLYRIFKCRYLNEVKLYQVSFVLKMLKLVLKLNTHKQVQCSGRPFRPSLMYGGKARDIEWSNL